MTSVPSPGTGFGVGVVDGSDLNNLLVDPVLFLLKRPMARLRQIVAQSLTNGTFTAITFTTHDVDQDWAGGTGHSDSSNTSRYTANYAGWYMLTGGISYAVSATGVRGAYWYVNGSPISGTETMGPASAAVNHGTAARGEMMYLNSGDYVELNGYQTSGGALNTAVTGVAMSTMNVVWMGN